MNANRTSTDWLRFWLRWVGANTLAWVIGWGIARYLFQADLDSMGAGLTGVAVGALVALAQGVVMGPLFKEILNEEGRVLVKGPARLALYAYYGLTLSWLALWAFGLTLAWSATWLVLVLLIAFISVRPVRKRVRLGRLDLGGGMIILLVLGIMFVLGGETFSALGENSGLFQQLVNSIWLPLLVGGGGSLITGIPLTLFMAGLPQSIVDPAEESQRARIQAPKEALSINHSLASYWLPPFVMNMAAWVLGWLAVRYGFQTLSVDLRVMVFGVAVNLFVWGLHGLALRAMVVRAAGPEGVPTLTGKAERYYQTYLGFIILWVSIAGLVLFEAFGAVMFFLVFIPAGVQLDSLYGLIGEAVEEEQDNTWQRIPFMLGFFLIGFFFIRILLHQMGLDFITRAEMLGVFGQVQFPLVLGGLSSAILSIPLALLVRQIHLDSQPETDFVFEETTQPRRRNVYGMVILILFVAILLLYAAATEINPCGWVDVVLQRSGCLAKLERGGDGEVNNLVFSPDGAWLLESRVTERMGGLWSMTDGMLITRINFANLRGYQSLVFSGDATWLIASSSVENTIDMYAVENWQLVRRAGEVYGGISPNGRILATAQERTIHLWRVADGKLLDKLEGHRDVVVKLVFSPDGTTLASWSLDGTLKVWDVSSGAVSFSENWSAALGGVFHRPEMVYTPDGNLVAAIFGIDGLYLYRGGEFFQLATVDQEIDRWFIALTISPDGSRVAMGAASNAWVWRVSDNGLIAKIEAYSGDRNFNIKVLAFSPDGKLLAVGVGDEVQLWPLPGYGK